MSTPPVATTRMTFDDEFNTFNSSSTGATGWMTSLPYGAEAAYTLAGNNEAEFYGSATAGLNPFSLQNGVLDITATPAGNSNPYGLPYNSGVITTAGDFSQTYGYFEVRAELPAGAGLWPAFWLLPASLNYTSELDVFEQLGSAPSTIYSTVHGATNGVWGANSQAFQVANTSTGFHTYGVDWEAGTTTYYMDGVAIGSAPTPASMNNPMFMLIDLAVGGNGSWPGAPTSASTFPATLQIDYVHAYATAGTTFVGGSQAIPASAAVATTPTTTSTATSTGTTTATTGTETLNVQVAEDAWSGDAQFQIFVDGVAVGGLQTATASNAAGATNTVSVTGTWDTGPHKIGVQFTNDAYGGSASMDRNLYVYGVTLNGVAGNGPETALYSDGTANFTVPAAPAVAASVSETLSVQVSEDAWNGDAQFQLTVDGVAIGGIQTATASHAAGLTNTVSVSGNWSSGAHTIGVDFLNDAYGGSASMDRNLYVSAVSLAGVSAVGAPAALLSDGTAAFSVQSPTTVANPAASTTVVTSAPATTTTATSTATQTLSVQVSEDAWSGDAQFQLIVDGTNVGGIQTATASHAAGLANTVSVTGNWGSGSHVVGVDFLNDAYGGSATMDRNLYVSGVTLGGVAATNGSASLMGDGTQAFIIPANVSNVLTLNMSEDAYLGDALFTVSVDGQQIGGTQTATTLHASGNSQAFGFALALSAGTHDVAVSFLNDAYGGSASLDRNLYVNSASYGGTSITGATSALLSNGTNHFAVAIPSTT